MASMDTRGHSIGNTSFRMNMSKLLSNQSALDQSGGLSAPISGILTHFFFFNPTASKRSI